MLVTTEILYPEAATTCIVPVLISASAKSAESVLLTPNNIPATNAASLSGNTRWSNSTKRCRKSQALCCHQGKDNTEGGLVVTSVTSLTCSFLNTGSLSYPYSRSRMVPAVNVVNLPDLHNTWEKYNRHPLHSVSHPYSVSATGRDNCSLM
jgi:hypothetical protein